MNGKKNKTEMIKKIKAKRSFNIEKFSYSDVIKNEIYIGQNKRRWNPVLMGYVYKVVNKIHIIDITNFLNVLKRGLYFISEIVRNRGKFVIAGNSKPNGKLILKLILKSKQPYIKTLYYAGAITRRKENLRQYIEVRKGLTNLEVRKKFINQLLGLSLMRKKPAIMVILDAYQGKYLINECKKLGISTMGCGSTNLNLPNLTYKLIGNFVGRKQRVVLLILIYHAIFEGIRKETKIFASYSNDIKQVKQKIIGKQKDVSLIKQFKKNQKRLGIEIKKKKKEERKERRRLAKKMQMQGVKGLKLDIKSKGITKIRI